MVGKKKGQSFVELALTLPFLLMLTMGVVDVGFVLYAHVQVASATGEAARVASHYPGDASLSDAAAVDAARLTLVKKAVYDGSTTPPTTSLGFLKTTAPYFTLNNDVWIDGYDAANPGGKTRTGEEITVHVRYSQPILFGIVPGFTGQRFTLTNATRVRVP